MKRTGRVWADAPPWVLQRAGELFTADPIEPLPGSYEAQAEHERYRVAYAQAMQEFAAKWQ